MWRREISRLNWRLVGMIALAVATLAISPSALQAQNEVKGEFADPANGAQPAGEQPEPAAPAAAPAANDAGGEAPALPSNYLAWTVKSLGWSYTIVFLAISITLLSLVVMCILAVRQENVCPADLVEGVEQQLNEGNVQAAAEMVRTDESFLGQVLAAGLSKLDRGYNHAVEAMQEVGEEETMKLEHQLSYIALIGSISPMIGLFGTVQGMITTFQVISTSNSTPKPSELAEGISTALFTTLVGLLIAIPAISVFNILRNRIQRLTLKVGTASETLLERFEPTN